MPGETDKTAPPVFGSHVERALNGVVVAGAVGGDIEVLSSGGILPAISGAVLSSGNGTKRASQSSGWPGASRRPGVDATSSPFGSRLPSFGPMVMSASLS